MTAPATTQPAAQTRREYLVAKGLASPAGGRFSKAAHEEIARAQAAGVVFTDAK